MSFEVIVPLLSAVAGATGIIFAVKDLLIKNKNNRNIKIQIGDSEKIEIASDVSDEDLEKIIEILRSSEGKVTKVKIHKKESGFITSEFFLLGVPGIIALLLVGTFIYLILENQGNPNYSSPKELSAAMTTILGYYFGVGASAAAQKSKTLTAADVQQILAEQNG